MKNAIIRLTAVVFMAMAICMIITPMKTYAATEGEAITETAVMDAESAVTVSKSYAAALCIGIVAAAGAIGMAITIKASTDGIARQPEAEGKIRTTMMLGLVFVETAIIYALIVAILIIFVL